MKINMQANGGSIEGLRLGIQTNRGNVEKQSLFLAKAWAPMGP